MVNKEKYINLWTLGPLTWLLKDKISGDFFDDTNEIVINLLSWENLKDTKKFLEDNKWKKIISHSLEIIDIFTDKFKTKNFLEKKWFDVTKWFKIENFSNLEKDLENLDFPVVLKETNNLAWVWIYIFEEKKDLLNFNFKNWQDYIIEEFIEWLELSANVFIHNLNKNDLNWEKSIIIFPPIEKWYTWIDENWNLKHYLTKNRSNLIDEKIEKEVRNISLQIWNISWVNWFLEVEFIYDKNDDKLKIIEVNPRISWTFNLAIEAWDYNIEEILNTIKFNQTLYSNNILNKKILLEYSISHKTNNFESSILKLPKWAKIISSKKYTNFPPFLELFLLEFENKEDLRTFLTQNKKNEN